MTTHHDSHQHDHRSGSAMERHCDVAIIGASAAGLAAALQLARQRRTVIAVDDGTPRNAPADHMHGYLGREGAAPSELVAVGREEVRGYGGEVLTGRVLAVHPAVDGRFRVELSGGHTLLARRVLAATGIVDELPDIEGVAQRWGQDVIHCPFCHGYEVRDQRLVQVISHPMGLHPTAVLRHLTDRLTVVLHGVTGWDSGAEATVNRLEAAGVPVVRTDVRRVVTGPDGGVTGVELVDGTVVGADAVLVGTRFHARLEALAPLGIEATPHPTGLGEVLQVDPMTGQTAVAGVYAAGNLTDPSLQVLPSAAHGSRVGAMIAFSLADEDLRSAQRTSGEEGDWDARYGTGERMWSGNPNGTLVAEVGGMPPGRALDVGAGEGGDVLWLAEQGWDVTASDISGAALEHVGAEAGRRGLGVTLLHRDANAPGAFESGAYDLVSLQYGSFLRTPEQRGLRSLLGAVAPGGTLLVVGHDLSPLREPVDPAEQTLMFDPGAYVGAEEVAAALEAEAGWRVEVFETRPRPAGATSTHHVDDVVLRAVREG
ncbi:bifunctional NAD(P)/FAD-dependent oxidoreductase/class I SAM-dependent methyltransferase [uncultured Serinicoccus sp.]|uniref:bifunctional NAD(P)/FAD-dependent oxidoreductase/class I SAM-dependent methyltransferase n=1 Tax=uncultured Serinicoccus sp. TaxID=735514 RepID=UPI00262892FC|nr:bifunctional NAD(P)/FAD-dependent oxidoreductase/class I SAM-dependent methyltransferase [uncultured Serinicoccus sp.]